MGFAYCCQSPLQRRAVGLFVFLGVAAGFALLVLHVLCTTHLLGVAHMGSDRTVGLHLRLRLCSQNHLGPGGRNASQALDVTALPVDVVVTIHFSDCSSEASLVV